MIMCAVKSSAALVAEDEEDDEQQEEGLQLVTFKVGDEEYGVNIMDVQEIIRMGSITRLPQAPAYVEGIMSLRGSVLLVVDLRKRLNLPPLDRTSKSRIVVANVEGKILGLIVDNVSSVLRLPEGDMKPAAEISGVLQSAHVSGIGHVDKRLIVLLNLDSLLSKEELRAINPESLVGQA